MGWSGDPYYLVYTESCEKHLVFTLSVSWVVTIFENLQKLENSLEIQK